MKAIISAKHGGFVVEGYFEECATYEFKPLRNFGDNQSDAIDFRNDVENGVYSEERLKSMARNYAKNVFYKRIGTGELRKQ